MKIGCSDLKKNGLIVLITTSVVILSACQGDPNSIKEAANHSVNRPPEHPWLAASHAPSTHVDAAQSDFVDFAGPIDQTRTLTTKELMWKAIGPIQAYDIQYASPYPDGTRAIWVGCYDRITKLDAQTLETLAELRLEGEGIHYWTDNEVEKFVDTADSLTGQPLYDHILDVWLKPLPAASCNYRFLDKNNDLYTIQSPLGEGPQYLRVYGDADSSDPHSAIIMKREWEIPKDIAPDTRGFGINMTYDGWVILATYSGVVFAIKSDFSEFRYITLPRKTEATLDFFAAYIRNGFPLDDEGGIYIVTTEYMARLQWTGDNLSLDTEDGAWMAEYPTDPPSGDHPVGSGTTPVLMGWGEGNDKLVIIGDGKIDHPGLIAYWRDEIPSDWEGIPGYSRQVAGVLPIPYWLEQGLPVDGYGVYVFDILPGPIANQGSPAATWLAQQYAVMDQPDIVPAGGLKAVWDPQSRTLKQVWKTDVSCATSVAVGSRASNQIYCFGLRDKNWTLEAIDWTSGASTFHYILGHSHKFNIAGGVLNITDNNVLDCACPGGMGIVRIKPAHVPTD